MLFLSFNEMPTMCLIIVINDTRMPTMYLIMVMNEEIE